MTIETVTTTTVRRRVRGRVPTSLTVGPVVGLLVLLALGLSIVRVGIEDDLTQRSRAAVADLGIDVSQVEIELTGRDAVVEGSVPSTQATEMVRATVAAVEGVRTADVDGLVAENG